MTCARERLGEAAGTDAPAAPRSRRRILAALFATEHLPADPPAPPAAPRPRWLRWLFVPEPLPHDPEPPPRRRPGRLAALFGRERLDDSP